MALSIEELAPVERNMNLRFGSLIHQCLESWHTNHDLAETLELIEKTCAYIDCTDVSHSFQKRLRVQDEGRNSQPLYVWRIRLDYFTAVPREYKNGNYFQK